MAGNDPATGMVRRRSGDIALINALNCLTALDIDSVFQGTKSFLLVFGEILWQEYHRHGVVVGLEANQRKRILRSLFNATSLKGFARNRSQKRSPFLVEENLLVAGFPRNCRVRSDSQRLRSCRLRSSSESTCGTGTR